MNKRISIIQWLIETCCWTSPRTTELLRHPIRTLYPPKFSQIGSKRSRLFSFTRVSVLHSSSSSASSLSPFGKRNLLFCEEIKAYKYYDIELHNTLTRVFHTQVFYYYYYYCTFTTERTLYLYLLSVPSLVILILLVQVVHFILDIIMYERMTCCIIRLRKERRKNSFFW